MQIIPVSKQKDSGKWIKESTYIDGTDEKGEQNHIFTIGKERIELVIPCDGVLHFAVNDVVMSDKNIKDMYLKSLQLFEESIKGDYKEGFQSYIDYFNKIFNKKDDKDSISLKDSIIKNDNVIEFLKKYKGGILSIENNPDDKEKNIKRKGLIDSLKNLGYGFGVYYQKDDSVHNGYPFVNELIYYFDKKYRDPWYMDNVGSFLIVIERKTNK